MAAEPIILPYEDHQDVDPVPRDAVLIVDDDPRVRTFLQRIVRRHIADLDVLTAVDGEDALRALNEREFDVVVTDQRMPKMTGVELLERIHEEHPGVARIVLTGYASLDVVKRALNTGHVDAFLEKPVDAFAFQERIRTLLDERRAQRARERAFERASMLHGKRSEVA